MLLPLRALAVLLLFTGAAAAQTAAAERGSRNVTRDARPERAARADRTVQADRKVRAERAVRADRATAQADRKVRAVRGQSAAARDVVAQQTPAERASRTLNQETRADRFRDAARDARGDDRPIRPEVQQFDAQRRTLQPDVGRPEQDGRTSTGNIGGGIPSMGPNPQR